MNRIFCVKDTNDLPELQSWHLLKTILYLHNTIIHRFYPPKKLHRHCFRFPLVHLHVPGEITNNDYAKFWGVKEMHYGIRESRELSKMSDFEAEKAVVPHRYTRKDVREKIKQWH